MFACLQLYLNFAFISYCRCELGFEYLLSFRNRCRVFTLNIQPRTSSSVRHCGIYSTQKNETRKQSSISKSTKKQMHVIGVLDVFSSVWNGCNLWAEALEPTLSPSSLDLKESQYFLRFNPSIWAKIFLIQIIGQTVKEIRFPYGPQYNTTVTITSPSSQAHRPYLCFFIFLLVIICSFVQNKGKVSRITVNTTNRRPSLAPPMSCVSVCFRRLMLISERSVMWSEPPPVVVFFVFFFFTPRQSELSGLICRARGLCKLPSWCYSSQASMGN